LLGLLQVTVVGVLPCVKRRHLGR